jgi:hypothetical protein
MFAKSHCTKAFPGPISGSYPAKTIAKNFVSLITYPHSDSKHFEKRLSTKRTYIFCEIFLRLQRDLCHSRFLALIQKLAFPTANCSAATLRKDSPRPVSNGLPEITHRVFLYLLAAPTILRPARFKKRGERAKSAAVCALAMLS